MQDNTINYKEMFSNISSVLSFFSKAKEEMSNLDDLYSTQEEYFDSYRSNNNSYFVTNVKLRNLYCDAEDVVSYDKELNSNLKKVDPSIRENLLDKIEAIINSDNYLLSDLIEMYRDDFIESLDIKSINYRKDFLKKTLDNKRNNKEDSYFKDKTKEELSLLLLEETLLGEAIMGIDISEDCWVGSSGGYFAPVSDNFFEDIFNEIEEYKYSISTSFEDVIEEFAECGLTYDEEKLVLINDKTGACISVFSDDDNEIEVFLKNALLNKSSCSDFEEFFKDDCESCPAEDLDLLKQSKSEFYKMFNALSFLFKYTEKEHESLNKKENFVSYVIDTHLISEIIYNTETHIKGLINDKTVNKATQITNGI